MNKHFYYKSKEDLSTRSQNIIDDLGGINQILDFYKKKPSFLGIRTAGKYSNEELISFCEYLLSKELEEKTTDIIENTEKANIEKYIYIYESEKKFLSVRAKNVINKLEVDSDYFLNITNKFEHISKLFLKQFDFSKLQNLGSKSIKELESLKDKILNSNLEDVILEKATDSSKNLNFANIEQCIFIYESEKEFLTVRAKNVLNKLEEDKGYSYNTTNKFEHITKLFLKQFDFSKLHNLGSKSALELESLKNKILNSKWDIEILEKDYFSQKISRAINNELSIKIDEKKIDEFFINEEYSFVKIFCMFLLYNNKLKDKYFEILKYEFFNTPPSTKKTIADELQCSYERIRQINNHFNDTLIPWAVNSVFKIFESKPYDLPEPTKKNILIIENFVHFSFMDITYTPNAELSKTTFSYAYKKDYELIDNLIIDTFKSFEIPGINLFVLKIFIEEIQLTKLLDWLDEQIYNFETIAFDYRLEVLIKRYYQEQNKFINDGLLKDLNTIVKTIKKEDFRFNEKANKRLNDKHLIDSILNEVFIFLNEKKEAQTTKKILTYLSEKNLVIEKHELLRHLNNKKSTFSYFGTGNWTLREWNNSDKVVGSFRDIVRNLLSSRTEPIHISELYEHINSMKKVSLNSISTNLKAETEGTFMFFNCSYIGLTEKRYAENWHLIPQFRAFHLRERGLPLNKKSAIRDTVKYLSSKYGYPEQHLLFILDCKNGKYS